MARKIVKNLTRQQQRIVIARMRKAADTLTGVSVVHTRFRAGKNGGEFNTYSLVSGGEALVQLYTNAARAEYVPNFGKLLRP
jgi:hypothetical protein